MKSTLFVLSIATCFSSHCISVRADDSRSAIQWHTDFDTAQRRANESQRPLLIHFYASWCGPCQLMERQVLHQPDVLKRLGRDVVAVKLSQPDHLELAGRYGVMSLPTDIIVSPSGSVVWRNEGIVNSRRYVAAIARIAARFPDQTRTVVNREPVRKDNTTSSKQQFLRDDENRMIGVDGYCPVALVTRRDWKQGKLEFSADYKEIRYYMADSKSLQIFRSNPRQYAPKLLGCDPVLLRKSHRAVPGDTEFGAFFEDSLYFFENNENRVIFKADPRRYVRIQHAINVEEIERTRVR